MVQLSKKNIKRQLFFSLGLLAFGLGIIGVFLPVMPTTPFLLVATYFFSKSSQKFHDWIIYHPKLGPPIRDWNEKRIIRKRAKILATIAILSSLIFPMYIIKLNIWIRIITGVTVGSVLLYILTRPSK